VEGTTEHPAFTKGVDRGPVRRKDQAKCRNQARPDGVEDNRIGDKVRPSEWIKSLVAIA
jgi:hypothetical protein